MAAVVAGMAAVLAGAGMATRSKHTASINIIDCRRGFFLRKKKTCIVIDQKRGCRRQNLVYSRLSTTATLLVLVLVFGLGLVTSKFVVSKKD